MDAGEQVARVQMLSDQELLTRLSGVLGCSEQVALLAVYLGEVEHRRLHLLAGHGSMFAYCIRRLRMSEDEAYRRIEVARLGRRFPSLYECVATGRVSVSVAALLKAHLSEANHVALLDAVTGKTVRQTREVLAAWFPRPDVPASIRKLPQRRAGAAGSGGEERVSSSAPLFDGIWSDGTGKGVTAPKAGAPAPSRANRHVSGIEPLAPERFKVVFTADSDVKRKLDLAHDLLRHAVPQGELAAIIGRALDLLLEKTLRRRFAKTTGGKFGSPAASPDAVSTQAVTEPRARQLPNRTRRAVLERDGLRCTYVGPDGVRCESRAWLEHDHTVPPGLGGEDDPSNIRLRCRAHNRLAAEQVYGQDTIERIIARRRAKKHAG